MRGRVFCPIKREMRHCTHSYVQINIYDMSIEGLRGRGVDIKEMLQQIGCLCVVLDVPILTYAPQKPSAQVRRRKTFAGVPAPSHSVSLDHENMPDYVQKVDCTENDSTALTSTDGMNTCVTSQECPLTSTPHPEKETADFESYVMENPPDTLDVPSAMEALDKLAETMDANCPNENPLTVHSPVLQNLEELLTAELLSTACPPSTEPGRLTSSSQMENMSICEPFATSSQGTVYMKESTQSEGAVVKEDSFQIFSREVMRGLQSVNEVRVAPSKSSKLSSVKESYESRHSQNDVQLFGNEGSDVLELFHSFEEDSGSRTLGHSGDAETKMQCDIGGSENQTTDIHVAYGDFDVQQESSCERTASILENSAMDTYQAESDANGAKLSSLLVREKEQREACMDNENKMTEEESQPAGLTTSVNDGNNAIKCQMQGCPAKLLWRMRWGKGRLLDHVRLHWAKAVKSCKICNFKDVTFRRIHHHHKLKHIGMPYKGAISTESKEDMEELLRFWNMCFPGVSARGIMRWIPHPTDFSFE